MKWPNDDDRAHAWFTFQVWLACMCAAAVVLSVVLLVALSCQP